jgi:uncharacterized protein with GYD domain
MATYFMFGKYSLDAIKEISAKRTEKATALIEQHGGKLKSAYALLGAHDLVLIVEFPGIEQAMKTSVGLAKLTGISFTTSPAVSVEAFDKMMEK